MITPTPHPSLPDLARLLFATNPAEDALKPWTAPGHDALACARSSHALAALALTRAAKVRLWVPAYFCNQRLQAARDGGVDIVFYPINQDMTPNWAACHILAEQAPPDLFVLVHTFGVASPLEAARAFCEKTGAWLIEDAAHALGPTETIGQAGDAVLYSPHKTLGLPHGAVVSLTPALADGVRERLLGKKQRIGQWAVKQAIQALPGVGAVLNERRLKGGRDYLEDPAYTPLPDTPAIAKRVLGRLADLARDMSVIAQRRRANHAILSTFVPDLPVLSEAADAPYRWVLDCGDNETAQQLFYACRAHALPVETWPDLAPEVRAAPDRFGTTIALRERTVLLPVHQGLSPDRLAESYGPILMDFEP